MKLKTSEKTSESSRKRPKNKTMSIFLERRLLKRLTTKLLL
jgi:hypothetical protein